MKCPHCSIEFHDNWLTPWYHRGDVEYAAFSLKYTNCPSCEKSTIVLDKTLKNGPTTSQLVHPCGTMRPIAIEVFDPYASDYREAVEVLPISPKASAALSRGNLQAILRDKHNVKHADLSKEIQEFIARPTTPLTLKEVVDAVRNIGNFAAHPIKDQNTGQIVPVEPHEAEWLLDVLDALFDFTFVQPARDKARVNALNAKLNAAGKPPMKQSSTKGP